jgi:uncharacterized protein
MDRPGPRRLIGGSEDIVNKEVSYVDLNSILILIAIGSAAGILSGIFGIGGGIIIIPALIYILGFSQHKATGTSLAVLLPPIGIAAFIEYYRHGNVDFPAAMIIAATALAGAWLGSLFSNRISDPALRLSFGVMVVVMGISLIYGAVKKLGWF